MLSCTRRPLSRGRLAVVAVYSDTARVDFAKLSFARVSGSGRAAPSATNRIA